MKCRAVPSAHATGAHADHPIGNRPKNLNTMKRKKHIGFEDCEAQNDVLKVGDVETITTQTKPRKKTTQKLEALADMVGSEIEALWRAIEELKIKVAYLQGYTDAQGENKK